MYYMKFNPYNNKNLKFRLSDGEIKKLDRVWIFLDNFRVSYLTRDKYMREIKKKINKKYGVDKFYMYEKIVEKIYWNLVEKIKNDINFKPKLYLRKEYDLKTMENKILKRNVKIKESMVKKTYVVTKNNELIYKFNYPDDLDLLVSSIMINRSVYETIMSGEENLFNIMIEPYNNIIEFDFPFPNLNTIKSFSYSKDKRMENIESVYGVRCD